jgi:MscS family membrane protein
MKHIIVLVALLFLSVGAAAQTLPGQEEEVAVEEQVVVPDALGRETPRGMVEGLISALAAEDNAKASQYLQFDDELPEEQVVQIVLALEKALDSGGRVPTLLLSMNPQGKLDDGLAPDMEQVGTIIIDGEETPLLAIKSVEVVQPDESEASNETGASEESEMPEVGPAVWKISSETLSLLSVDEVELPVVNDAGEVEEAKSKPFLENRVKGAPIGDWLKLFALGAGLYIILRLLFAAGLFIARQLIADPKHNSIYGTFKAASAPASVYFSAFIFYATASYLEVSIIARQFLGQFAGVIGWIAFAWFLWRLIEALSNIWADRLRESGHLRATSLTLFVRRAAKVALVAIAIVAVFDTLGVDVTTGIAALGIGGLALALGAQKTIENIVGSVTIIVDQPLRVGDFCRIGDLKGTVLDIGMRSTKIKTLDRTVVSIPNGELASQEIENYAHREKFFFNPTLGLGYELEPDGLRKIIDVLKKAVSECEYIYQDNARVALRELNSSSFDVEVRVYIRADDFDDAVAKEEALLLQFIGLVRENGGSFAFPTRSIFIESDETAK